MTHFGHRTIGGKLMVAIEQGISKIDTVFTIDLRLFVPLESIGLL